jgi:hypothetical protein
VSAEPRFLDVLVEPDADLPDGLQLRFKLAGDPRPIESLRYAPEDAPETDCAVVAREPGGLHTTATAVLVEDSSAGLSILVSGGRHGLGLRALDGSGAWFETHLLLRPEALR